MSWFQEHAKPPPPKRKMDSWFIGPLGLAPKKNFMLALVRKFVLSVPQMLETCARSLGCKSIAGGLFWNMLWIGASTPPCRGHAICSHPPAQAENLTQPKTESQNFKFDSGLGGKTMHECLVSRVNFFIFNHYFLHLHYPQTFQYI